MPQPAIKVVPLVEHLRQLARPKEIGAAWARKGDKKGAIISLDIISTDLVNRNGVLFMLPVDNGAEQ